MLLSTENQGGEAMAQREDDQKVIDEGASSSAAATGSMGTASSEGDNTTKSGKAKRKARPRLTVQPDVMKRLRAMATEREMTASELAEELLTKYLNNIPEEDDGLVDEEDEEADAGVEEESNGKVDQSNEVNQ